MHKFLVCVDIGGTKILLWLGQSINGKIQMHLEHQYDSSSFTDFSEVLCDFLSKAETVTKKYNPIAACFAVAGPIVAQRANLTNLPWLIDSTKISMI